MIRVICKCPACNKDVTTKADAKHVKLYGHCIDCPNLTKKE